MKILKSPKHYFFTIFPDVKYYNKVKEERLNQLILSNNNLQTDFKNIKNKY